MRGRLEMGQLACKLKKKKRGWLKLISRDSVGIVNATYINISGNVK